MSFFSFNFNLNLIYVLIYWLFNISLQLLIDYKYEELFRLSKKNYAENEYIYIIFIIISNLMNGFLIIYVNCSTKKRSKVENTNNTKLIYRDPLKYRNRQFFLKLILISSIELFNLLSYFIFFSLFRDAKNDEVAHKGEKDIISFFDIIMRYIFSIFILKTKVYKHHLWSIYAIIIGFILIVPFDIMQFISEKDKNTVYSFIFIGISSLRSIFYPLIDTLIKTIYRDYYILPENLLFLMGIIESILIIIITLILFFSNVLKFEFTFTFWNVFMSIIYTLISFIRQYIVAKIIYLFSSQSVSFLIISKSIAVGIKGIIDFFQSEEKNKVEFSFALIFGIISIFIIIMGTLVYDEIVIVNKFGLNLNVKRGIHERALSEVESAVDELEDDNSKSDANSELIDNNEIN